MMKKIVVLAMAAALAGAGLAGCDKGRQEADGVKAGGDDICALATAEQLSKRIAGEAATDEETVVVIGALRCCDGGGDKDCGMKKALGDLGRAGKKLAYNAANGEKLAKDGSVSVREYVAQNGKRFWGAEAKDAAAALSAFSSEQDARVLTALIRTYGGMAKDSGEVFSFLGAQIKNGDSGVKTAALGMLATPELGQKEGVVDMIAPLLDGDDAKVAKTACEKLGNLHTDKAVAPIAKILGDVSKESMHSSCMTGLRQLWLDYPRHEATSEAAYRATLDYLKRTPRTDKVPSFAAISSLNSINADRIGAWRAKAAYFNAADLVAALTDIVKDPESNWLARQSAIKGIATHGTKADLEALKPVIEKDPQGKLLMKTYDDMIAKK